MYVSAYQPICLNFTLLYLPIYLSFGTHHVVKVLCSRPGQVQAWLGLGNDHGKIQEKLQKELGNDHICFGHQKHTVSNCATDSAAFSPSCKSTVLEKCRYGRPTWSSEVKKCERAKVVCRNVSYQHFIRVTVLVKEKGYINLQSTQVESLCQSPYEFTML